MRSDIDNLINICSQEVWDAWSNTNNALARRSAETMETKSKLQMHLHKVIRIINTLRLIDKIFPINNDSIKNMLRNMKTNFQCDITFDILSFAPCLKG